MYNVIIIGSGPAGYTAAIYAARANLNPLLLAGDEVGGQLMTTTEVENFPGFPEGIQGPELMAAMRKQAERFETKIISEKATAVDFSGTPLKVMVGEEIYEAKTVIIATGASARRLGLPSEEALYGKGVSACATCDGFFFKDKKVVVVGGGDAAIEEAVFLTKFATSVTMLVRKDEFKASPIMVDRAKANEKISFEMNTEVAEVLGVEEGHVKGVRVRDTQNGDERDIVCDGMFVAIGHVPNTSLFDGILELDKRKYLITKDGPKTSISGVFAAGDVQDFQYRQAITSAASGCMAALEAQRLIEKEDHTQDSSE